MKSNPVFVTAAPGTLDLLLGELQVLGFSELREGPGGVTGLATVEQAQAACLWSRTGLHVLWQLAVLEVASVDALYAGVRQLNWSEHLGTGDTLAVDFAGRLEGVTHPHFGALRVKDAIVDQFREATGERPSVDRDSPDLRVNVYVARGRATVAIDFSGDSLHRRGYRGGQGAAPLKENLAAAILMRAGWPALAAEGGGFVDPMCGSGTLCIEAAMIAADMAPGMLRERFGFEGWRGHDPVAWQSTREAARARANVAALGRRIRGYDHDSTVLASAVENAARAGLGSALVFERIALERLPDAVGEHGLLATNPPYGERLGEEEALGALYALLGERLRQGYTGWHAAVLCANPALGRELGIRAWRTHRLMNGTIECRLLRLRVDPQDFIHEREPGRPPVIDAEAARARPGAIMFGNRLKKNMAQLAKWARKSSVACYRLYDADMPEYAFAIDLYQSSAHEPQQRWLYVQEYAAPASVDKTGARARREEALSVLGEITGLPESAIYWRTRRPQKGSAQYEALADEGERVVVEEDGLKFLVNFTDYLDIGLFLDHRLTRARIREMSRGKRFLNLFCYTAAATVHAAAGGAQSTVSVDLSRTYLDWARRNLEVNGFRGEAHRLERADCLQWLAADAGEEFDLIFLDPPTFSNSKRMEQELDIQRDHVELIHGAARRLAAGGVLLFSTNFRRFRLDSDSLQGLVVKDITASTLSHDFARNPRIHSCFEIRQA